MTELVDKWREYVSLQTSRGYHWLHAAEDIEDEEGVSRDVAEEVVTRILEGL